MVYDREGRSHSSPGYSYSGRNYHREKTLEEKEEERIKGQKRQEQKALEQEVKTSSKILPAMDRQIGIVVPKNGKARSTRKATVVLGKDKTELGYHAVTSYPVP